MAAETPTRIAIIGAGPLGIEAALYARYLGYDVIVFEQAHVGSQLSKAGAEILPTPAGKNRTSLGIAALQAQDGTFQLPAASASETAEEFLNSYLIPLAGSDLLASSICPLHTVLRIERTELSEDEVADADLQSSAENDNEEDEYEIEYAPFLLTIQPEENSEITSLSEIVIDASGLSIRNDGVKGVGRNERIERISSGLTNPLLAARHPCSRFMTEEPNFYRLGIPVEGDSKPVSLPTGHDQIRQIFTVIGERESLNLYKTFGSN